MELPIYEALISDVKDGVVVMSLVDEPATLTNWLCYKEDKQISKFSVLNDDEQLLLGVVMVADTPIYRRTADGYEYYIKYSKETLKAMAQKMLQEGTFNNISLDHNGEIIERGTVIMRELFIKDEEKGINPKGLEDVPNGSLLCTYKVNDGALWEMCKNGTFNGFSLEGYFTTELAKYKKQNKKNYMNKFKEALKKLLVEFGTVKTDKGDFEFDGEEIEVGVEVTIDGEVAADGDYTAEDGTIYTVKDGKVEAITKPQAEEEEEETVEETETETVENTEEVQAEEETVEEEEETVEEETTEETNEVAELRAELETLKAELEALKVSVNELLQTPAVDPIAETFAKVNNTDIKDEKVKRMCEYAKYLRK